jgi:hypothetical protein
MMRKEYHEFMELVPINNESHSKPHYSVVGDLKLSGRKLLWTMSCEGDGSWNVNSNFSYDYRKNWELWNWDVLEAFVQLRRNASDFEAPYLELQISPENKAFSLIILKPRVSFYTPLDLKIHSEVSLSGNLWSMNCEVELPDVLRGHELFAGLFACLGAHRVYYAPTKWPNAPLDFHQPQHFLSFN